MLCWFLPYSNMNQSQVYTCPLPLEPPSHFPPPSQPSRLSQSAKLSSLHHTENCTILHMIFICFNAALSIRPTLSFPDCVHSLFSLSVSLLMSCKWVQQYHFLRFHIHALIHDICFSFSDFILRNRF